MDNGDLRNLLLAILDDPAFDKDADLGQLGRVGVGVVDQVRELTGLWTLFIWARWVAVVDQGGMLDVSGGDEGRVGGRGRRHRWSGRGGGREPSGTRGRDGFSARAGH